MGKSNNLRRATLSLFDKQCLELVDDNKNMLVPWYLMASYAYYEEDNPILEDATFDRMSKVFLQYYDEIEHMHKYLITKEMLEAGTYQGEYPNRVKYALENLRGNNG